VGFQRARSPEQREERRRSILDTAAAMLREMPVAELSLNELARRVGLAKSNVLRYFETREAVLLELLDAEYTAWLDEVESMPTPVDADGVAELLAATAARRPVLAELLASAASVLEHNVSTEVAVAYKRRALARTARLVALVERSTGPLAGADGLVVAGAVELVVGGAWSICRPSPALLAAYERDPALAALRLDYRIAVRELIATTLAGLRVRHASLAP
jgi:AcrR family transcriptional regulator